MEIQEINLRSEKVLWDFHPPSLLEELEEEKKENAPQANVPPYHDNLIQPKQHTPEEEKLLGESKKLCVKIPLLQAIKDVTI